MTTSGRDDPDEYDDGALDDEGLHEEPTDGFSHAPVLKEEVLEHLVPGREGGVLWDLTLGLGGHTGAFLERAPASARAFGLDGDPVAVERAGRVLARFGERARVAHGSMRDLAEVTKALGWPRPTAVLMDLGLSSPQIEEASRGFSFRSEGPLDMRFDTTRGETAADLLLRMPSSELMEKIAAFGDEPLAREIVKMIKRSLPVTTTTQLAHLVLQAYGKTPSRVHPARRTFQALRMLVNDELVAVERAIDDATEALLPGGRIVVLSFHSGEDRVVKTVLRDLDRAGRIVRLNRRPIRPSEAECFANQRARSAKLRAAERRET